MKEKELRIALVCFGGVSLAVYMHGISKEILKLVRASSALHAIADRSARAAANFFDKADREDPEYDTEEIYFELFGISAARSSCASWSTSSRARRPAASTAPCWRGRSATTCRWARCAISGSNHADVTDLLAPDARASAGAN